MPCRNDHSGIIGLYFQQQSATGIHHFEGGDFFGGGFYHQIGAFFVDHQFFFLGGIGHQINFRQVDQLKSAGTFACSGSKGVIALT